MLYSVRTLNFPTRFALADYRIRKLFQIVTRFQSRKKSIQIVISTGSRNGSENFTTNSRNDGIFTPFCPAMALT